MFPDNTVLTNFALINRMDLLRRLANGKGRWCASVASECRNSAKRPDLTALDDAEDIFGEPLYPDQAELQDAQALRSQLAAPGDPRTQHLGEAETVAIAVRRQLDCIFITDDRAAARLAANNGIRVATTWDLLRMAHRMSWVDAATLWGYVLTIDGHGRGSPPGVWDRQSFNKWLGV